MLYDRPYMRADGDGGGDRWRPSSPHPMTTRLLIITISVFVLQAVGGNLLGAHTFFRDYFALSFDALNGFKVWTFLSYGFLHGTEGLFHIILNMLGLYFAGRIVEPILGSRAFLLFYLSAILLGGLTWLLTSMIVGNNMGFLPFALMGASAGVIAVVAFFCMKFPNQPITMLLFFVIPVTIKPKWLLVFLLVTEGLSFLGELTGRGGLFGSNIAHSAHLGGILAAYLMFSMGSQGASAFGFGGDGSGGGKGISIEPPRWFKKRVTRSTDHQKYKVNVTSRDAMQQEVDRILDKINKDGFGSLTLAEKETLDKARDFLKR